MGLIDPLLAQNVNDGFDPDAGDVVAAVAVQPDGKLVVGGFFMTMAGQPRQHVARLLPDGSLDPAFADTIVDGTVNAIALQADGRIVIGGTFAQVGAYLRANIARLNADGSVDASFSADTDAGVTRIVVQPGGQLVVAGSFTQVGTEARDHIARLDSNGGVDTGFNPGADAAVFTIVRQADGRLVVGGFFTQIAGAMRNGIARLNADGSIDAGFDPNPDSYVLALALQVDGSIVLGGDFTHLGMVERNRIARVDVDGNLDGTFNPNVDALVLALTEQADGKLVVGGNFTMIGTTSRNHLARLNSDGSLDDTFDPDSGGSILAIAQQSDEKLVIGGSFSQVGAASRNNIARLYVDGGVDATLVAEPIGAVRALASRPDGGLLVGGDFTFIDGQPRNYLARLNADGSLDMSFDPSPDNSVFELLQQPDGKVVAAGFFSGFSPNGGSFVQNAGVARLTADGNVDPGFAPNPNVTPPAALALQADGKVLIGGFFTSLMPNGGVVVMRTGIARLNADGSVDTDFDPNPNSGVRAIAVQADGKLVVGGNFSSLAPNQGEAVARGRIARLNPDGSVDASFDPKANNDVTDVLVQPDGKILIAGYFTSLAPNGGGSVGRNGMARLNADGSVDATFDPNPDSYVDALVLQTDGSIVLGGDFANLTPNGGAIVARSHLARLAADGSVDSKFDPQPDDLVQALALLPDGKLVAGGMFYMIGGQTRHNFARLSMPEAALQSFEAIGYSAGGGSVTWRRSGVAGEFALPPQLSFAAGSVYGTVGAMRRIDGGWRLAGYTLPLGTTFHLRARAQVASGMSEGSGGIVEVARPFHLSGNEGVFADGFD